MSDIALPPGKFGAILVDPPWSFQAWGKSGNKAPERHYTTMTAEDIVREFPVGEMAADDCALFMWITCPHLPQGFPMLEAWGFRYSTVAFTWVKVLPEKPRQPRIGLGYYTRANAELCLLGIKGHPKRLNRDVGQVIAEPIHEHSRKPDCGHERIERLVAGPYAEIFARQSWPGWTTWGDEADKFNNLTLDLDVPSCPT